MCCDCGAVAFVLMVSEEHQLISEASVTEMEKYVPVALSDGSYQAQPLFYAKNLYQRNGIYFHMGSAYGVYNCFSYDGETGDGVVVLTIGAVESKGQYDIYSICDEINAIIYEHINMN